MLIMTVLTFNNLIFLLLIPKCSATMTLIETAVNISSTYYNQHFATTVIWKQNESTCVDGFLKRYIGSVVLSPWLSIDDNNIRDINETIGFRQTICFASSLHEYAKIMQVINEIIRFPIRFILVLENPVNSATELSAYIEVTFKNDQADLVIISANDAEEVSLSTFFPYSENGLCKNYSPVFLNIGDDMFPQKFKNFYQCPIRVSLVEFLPFVSVQTEDDKILSVGGYDGETLMLIFEILNASIEITSANYNDKHGRLQNVTAMPSITDLETGKADIFIPAGILTQKRYETTLPSHAYHTKDIRWVGRKQREVYDYLKFIVPDRTNFTPIHGLTFVSFVIVAILVKKCKPHLTGAKNLILYQSFIILLGQSARFVTKSSLLNSLFILWIWFCFFFRIDYQADLVEALQTIDLEPSLDSIEEAVKKVDGYGGPEVFLDYYKGTSLEHNYKILSRQEVKDHIRRISEGENFLIATDVSLVQVQNKYVQILKKRISMTGTCFFMRPGWPAAKDVDDVIFSLVEVGFVKNIFNKGNHKLVLNEGNDQDEELTPRGLNMEKLSTCFYGLAIMWIICSVVLFVEIIYHKKKSANTK